MISVGIITITFVPIPDVEVRVMLPPSFSTICLQIVSPSPHPVVFLLTPWENLENIWKSYAWSYSLMPYPVSSTSNFTIFWCSYWTQSIILPLSVNFKEFETRFTNTYTNHSKSDLMKLSPKSFRIWNLKPFPWHWCSKSSFTVSVTS